MNWTPESGDGIRHSPSRHIEKSRSPSTMNGLLDMAVADGAPYVRFQSTVTPGLFLPPAWLEF